MPPGPPVLHVYTYIHIHIHVTHLLQILAMGLLIPIIGMQLVATDYAICN